MNQRHRKTDLHRSLRGECAWRVHVVVLLMTTIALGLITTSASAQQRKPGKPGTPAEANVEVEETDAGVAAILATKPTTPAQCCRAAKILADLKRPDLAKPLLKKTIDAKLDAQALTDLGQEVGTATFMNIAANETLLPEGKELADAVLDAVAARLQDNKRVAELIEQLKDPSQEKQYRAMVALQEIPRASVAMLIEALADPSKASEYANLRSTLLGMGRLGREVLVGVLEDADPDLSVQVISILAEIKNPTVERALLAPAFSDKSDAKVKNAALAALQQLRGQIPKPLDVDKMLFATAKNYFDHRQPLEGEINGKVELWRWNPQEKQCVARNCTVNEACRLQAARWARDAYRVSPGGMNVQTLYLATQLDAAQYDAGLDQPLAEDAPIVIEAKKAGVLALNEVLAYAMSTEVVSGGHVGAAIATARLLGQIGDVKQALYKTGTIAPLALALRSPDRRVRMTALQAIMQLKPTAPYPGSSEVPSALAFFISTSGKRHVLAAAPNIQHARTVGGMLIVKGLEADVAGTGKQLMQIAVASPDYELALIDVSTHTPEIGILLQQLRHDERTASLRVGLLARDGFLAQAEHAAESDTLSKVFAWPIDENAAAWQVDQLATIAPEEFVDFDVRQRQAGEALKLLAELFCSPGTFYDLRRTQSAVLTALYVSKLSEKAMEVLACMNSAESQQALLEVADRLTLPLPMRTAAVKAFRLNMERHGILLTSEEIRRQYRFYNESKDQDVASQRVLGLILDCLEAPTKDKDAPKTPPK
jgi:hypothetical protein